MNPVHQRRAVGERDTGVRERLLAAAATLIADEGAAAATSRAISTRAGENLAAITYYFGSKDELVSEALIRQARALVEPVVAELMSNRPQLEDLARAVDMLTTLLDERRDQLVGYLACLARAPHQVGLARAVRYLGGWRSCRSAKTPSWQGKLLFEEHAGTQAGGHFEGEA